jgi:hypothetical protein
MRQFCSWGAGVAGSDAVVMLHNSLSDSANFEVIEDGKPRREWCGPADLSNKAASISLAK